MGGPDFGALGEEAELVEVEPEPKQEILENKDVSTWKTSEFFLLKEMSWHLTCFSQGKSSQGNFLNFGFRCERIKYSTVSWIWCCLVPVFFNLPQQLLKFSSELVDLSPDAAFPSLIRHHCLGENQATVLDLLECSISQVRVKHHHVNYVAKQNTNFSRGW